MTSPHALLRRMNEASIGYVVPDPGDAGTLRSDRQFAVFELVTAAAETRTLANPAFSGQRLTLVLKTDGGDCTITASTAIDAAGTTSIVMGDAGDMLDLVAVSTSTTAFAWRIVASDVIAGVGFLPLTGGSMTGTLTSTADLDVEGIDNGGTAASASSWTTSGIQYDGKATTYTDSSTAGSGTAATAVFTSFAQPTLAATNSSVTTTDAATVYIAAAPTAGTNQTITNAHALWVDAGNTRLDGTLELNGAITIADAIDIAVNTSTGTKIGTATGQKLSVYNATPVAQQATTGTTTGFTAGVGTAVNDDSTFTGGSGTAAYTIGDIVLALKNFGLMAAS